MLRRIACVLMAAVWLLTTSQAHAQRTQFPAPAPGAPPVLAPPPTAPPLTTAPALTTPPPAAFSGGIQPLPAGTDFYGDPSLQGAPLYQPHELTQNAVGGATGTGNGYLFMRPDGTVGEYPRLLQQLRLRYTWIMGGDSPDDLGMNIAELDGTFVIPFPYCQSAPLLITPGFAVNWLQGPQSNIPPLPAPPPAADNSELPARLYEAYLDAGWRPHISERWSADLGFRIGDYADDDNFFSGDSLRYIGRGYAVYTSSPKWEFKAGVLYLDRLNIKLLPAGGAIWTPDNDTRWEILFPNPKLAWRLTTFGNVDLWGYVAGEYGGGTWTIDHTVATPNPVPPGFLVSSIQDKVEYDDFRVMGGLEWIGHLSLKGFVEAGYVFERKLRYQSGEGNMDPDNTWMIRGGIAR
jgi:hypothetical protein